MESIIYGAGGVGLVIAAAFLYTYFDAIREKLLLWTGKGQAVNPAKKI